MNHITLEPIDAVRPSTYNPRSAVAERLGQLDGERRVGIARALHIATDCTDADIDVDRIGAVHDLDDDATLRRPAGRTLDLVDDDRHLATRRPE